LARRRPIAAAVPRHAAAPTRPASAGTTRAAPAIIVALLALLVSHPGARAEETTQRTASPALSSSWRSAPPESRWAVEARVGRFEPDFDDYERFYGDRRSRDVGLTFAWRFRNWLEAGGSLGRSRDSGLGLLPDGSLGGAVQYVVMPAQAWVSVRWDRGGRPLVVPYLGLGVARAYYSQRVELQPRRRGRSDTGHALRAGLQFSLDRMDPRNAARYGDSPLKRSFIVLEMQRLSTEVAGTQIGGDAWSLGFRFEFGRRDSG
jgi:hypothetical protein